jgi:hypothetical protein
MKSFLGYMGALVIAFFIIFLGYTLRLVLLPVRVVDKSIGTVEGVIDKTLTADNAIYNYEWFKQQVEDIKAIKAKAVVADDAVNSFEFAAGIRKDWTFEDKNEDARLRAVAQGLRSQLEDMIATYNARTKMANRNIFQDGKIPMVLEIGSNLLK